jgi:hypothetical protein
MMMDMEHQQLESFFMLFLWFHTNPRKPLFESGNLFRPKKRERERERGDIGG